MEPNKIYQIHDIGYTELTPEEAKELLKDEKLPPNMKKIIEGIEEGDAIKMERKQHRTQVAQRLKKARELINVTQKQVEKAIGINERTLGGYENGVSQPDLYSLSILAEYYGKTTDWIIKGG